MKKGIMIIIILIILSIVPLLVYYSNYKSLKNEIYRYNLNYEQYLNSDITGIEVGTMINNATNNNEKNGVEKNENQKYIDDNKYYTEVYIEITTSDDETTTYDMETINSLGIERFIKNFNVMNFKCTSIEYNDIGRVKRVIYTLN
jgi:type II secretory pathway pseudopilin PulG